MAFPEQSQHFEQHRPDDFPATANFGASGCKLIPDQYVSLRQPLRAIAIDSKRNGIVDDAISFEIRGQDLVGCVSVAHLSSRVERASALERNLLRVGRSVFNGDYCAIALFPRDIHPSEIGLVVGQVRPTLSCELFFNAECDLYDARFFLSATRLTQRCTYADSARLFCDRQENEAFRAGLVAVRKLSELRMRLGGDAFLTVGEGHIERYPNTDLPSLIKTQPGAFISAELMIIYNYLASRLVGDEKLHALYRYVNGNASYGSRGLSIVPMAHDGLGLDRYMRATSPCRNAEDYVNQAILTATILGQPAPFEAQELSCIAQRFEDLSRGLAGRTQQSNINNLDLSPMQWRDLDHAEFSENLRSCALRQEFTEALRNELAQRLSSGQVCSGDLYYIIFATRNCANQWVETRKAAVELIRTRQGVASEILEWAGVSRPYALLRSEIIERRGSSNSFAGTSVFYEGNDMVESQPVIGHSMRDVSSTAAFAVLEQIASGGWTQPNIDEPERDVSPQVVELRGNHTHKRTAELFARFIASLEAPHVRYAFTSFRLPQGPVHEVMVSVSHSSGEFHSRTYRERSRAAAQRAAQYELLAAHAAELLDEAVTNLPSENPIMQLYSECERAHFGRPKFEIDLFFPENENSYSTRVCGYVELEAGKYIFAGPVVSFDRDQAKLLVAQRLRAKIVKFWGGQSDDLVDWAFVRSRKRGERRDSRK